jgi:hypothetical protein
MDGSEAWAGLAGIRPDGQGSRQCSRNSTKSCQANLDDLMTDMADTGTPSGLHRWAFLCVVRLGMD